MIPRYRISCLMTFFCVFFLLGVAAGFPSSLGCFVASKYVMVLLCWNVSFSFVLCWSCVPVEDTTEISSFIGSLATFPGSGVIATVTSVDWRLGVGGSTSVLELLVGANDNFVCFGPGELISLAVSTQVCLVLSPPLGDASFPVVLVGFRFPF